MSLAKYNPKQAATEGRKMRLNIAGMTDRKIYIHVLGEDSTVVSECVANLNKTHFEENGAVERTPDQVLEFLRAKFAVQVTGVETQMLDQEHKPVGAVRTEIEVEDDIWLPAGSALADKVFAEDMKFVYEPIFAYARNRSNFLPGKGAN